MVYVEQGRYAWNEVGILGTIYLQWSFFLGKEGAVENLVEGVPRIPVFLKCHSGHKQRIKSREKRVEAGRTMTKPTQELRQQTRESDPGQWQGERG